jgi:hypothetical protein
MALPAPEPGLVIRYNYLWLREAERGRDGAAKGRPCAVVTAVRRSGDRVVVSVVPITHAPPHARTPAIPLPNSVKRVLGLDDEPSWIIVDEANTFEWPGPDLEPIDQQSRAMSYGRLPKPVITALLHAVLGHIHAGRLRTIKRTE